MPGTNPPDPNDPDNGIDPTLPIDPDKEVPSGEVVVPVDPAGGLAADPQIKVYGDPDPELTYTLPEDLIKPGDIWGELERVPGEDVGSYTIFAGYGTKQKLRYYLCAQLPYHRASSADDHRRGQSPTSLHQQPAFVRSLMTGFQISGQPS